ncbi:hypothetical protein ACFYMW_39840 [Streptomyces sp. NPDC006692]|uniref:hypothetical protein n=1 Tax=Streptomyces sp. NPDC006692 TaxID=3364758 RepID=UPI00369DE596
MMNTRPLLTASALTLGALALAVIPANADESLADASGLRQLEKLNQLGQITQVTKSLDPALGLLAPVTGLAPI